VSDDASLQSTGGGNGDVPPYEIPAIDEEIRVFDATSWQRTVPAVYLGYERISGDFFMHRIRSADGVENTLASHAVFRRHDAGDGGERWEPLTKRPRAR
jgi:hypothetical protein